jgi:hypothetical protein
MFPPEAPRRAANSDELEAHDLNNGWRTIGSPRPAITSRIYRARKYHARSSLFCSEMARRTEVADERIDPVSDDDGVEF